MSESHPHLVFAYGTLMRGDCRFYLLEEQQFLGEASTQPGYRIVNCGSYPGLLVSSNSSQQVDGEVWAVTDECLRRLDEEEGVDVQLYERRPIPLLGEFADAHTEAYFYLPDAAGLPDCGRSWQTFRRNFFGN
ncbi:MAG: gamma-glutamylcyclotransferase [Planctomycetaceae bacterium]|nr:gamma-glutamylcyclotransferase [Planctomycetaceae bacterium]MCB9952719.1 gamma-glutamylcyclotransferase [Planctomycetaceae bacterium]